jgi:hypothetical protein
LASSRSRSESLLPLWLCIAASAGCGFDPGGFAGSAGGTGADGGPGGGLLDGGGGGRDGGSDAGDCNALLPFVPSNFAACNIGAVNPALVLDQTASPYRLDTGSGVLEEPDGTETPLIAFAVGQDDGPPLLLIAFESLFIANEAVLDIAGTRALALVATGDMQILGSASVGAVGSTSGAGGDNNEACADGRGADGELQVLGLLVAGAGGGGGAFSTAGGEGAPVDGAAVPTPTDAGQAGGSQALIPLRGGCAGGDGGGDGGSGGGAGGALQLVAGGTLTVAATGIVTARGGGGGGVSSVLDGGGGGGGGAGGGLLLEAMTVKVDGKLTANGGSGGEGTRTGNTTTDGSDGFDDRGDRAPGGAGGEGGDGGDGGALGADGGADGQLGTSTGMDLAGGGGGGGSAGRIHLRSIAAGAAIGGAAVVSPSSR